MAPTDDLVARCLELFQQQCYAEASALACGALEDHPEHPLLWQLHGTACWFLQDYPGARNALETAVFHGPLQPLSRVALAGTYARTGEPAAAVGVYRHLLQDERTPAALLPRISVGLGSLGEDWLALQVCRKLARLQPHHHAAFFGMAYYMARMEYPAECFLRHLLRAHQLQPDRLTYRVNLALALAELGQDDQAYDLVKDVAPESVGCICWLRRLAVLCAAVGDDARRDGFARRLEQVKALSARDRPA